MTDKYHPVTKEELEVFEECLKFIVSFGEYRGRNILPLDVAMRIVDTIRERPDPLALLEAWREYNFLNTPDISYPTLWAMETKFINQLRENPEAVRQQGIEDGW